jgi:hypothetical protein
MDYDKLPDIPQPFFNSETNQPFSNCLVCECNLMEESQPYAIERAIRHYPEMELKSVVFEYALCAKCIAQTENELSDDTKMSITQYFAQNLDLASRPQWKSTEEEDENSDLVKVVPFDINEWIDTCSVKGVSRSELYEYTLCARCIGGKIIPEVVPYMISGLAQDDIVDLFSNKSLGFLDDFTDKHFSGPPELKELFKGRPILV